MSLSPVCFMAMPFNGDRGATRLPSWGAVIFRDIHFWVPLATLVAGALILYLVQ
jgi:hypothetical protein